MISKCKRINQKLLHTLKDCIYIMPFFNPGFLNPYIFYLYFNYRKHGVPYRQVASLYTLRKISELLDNAGIEHFLNHGILLGAVRQGAFAGRPGDIELAIKNDNINSLLNLDNILKSNGFTKVHNFDFKVRNRAKIEYYSKFKVRVTIMIYTLVTLDNGSKIFKRLIEDYNAPTFEQEQFLKPENAKIFDYTFKIPKNPEKFFIQKYGENWKIPTSRQYAWRKDDEC